MIRHAMREQPAGLGIDAADLSLHRTHAFKAAKQQMTRDIRVQN